MIELCHILFAFLMLGLSSFITFGFTKMLDSYMDYGEIFDFIRVRLAKYFSKKNEIDLLLDETINKTFGEYSEAENLPFFARQEEMSEKYWALAYHSKTFKLFLCVDCISVYVGFFISLSFSLSLINYFGLTYVLIPVYFLLNNVFTYVLLNRNNGL